MSEKSYMTIQIPEEPYRDYLERLKTLPDRVSYAKVTMYLIDQRVEGKLPRLDKIWAAIEKCFPINDTVWMPGDLSCTLYDEIGSILEEGFVQ